MLKKLLLLLFLILSGYSYNDKIQVEYGKEYEKIFNKAGILYIFEFSIEEYSNIVITMQDLNNSPWIRLQFTLLNNN